MAEETANDLTRTPDGDPIMTTKLSPPGLPPWWVTRERLRSRLDGGVTRHLTLVVGPAGSGKSTLVADWAAAGRADGETAWLSLEEADDQPGVFWSYVLAALERVGVQVPLHRRHATADAVDRSFLIRLAVGLAARPEPVVLVLDNVHLLSRQSILDGLHFLIDHAGPQLRVVLLSRTDPPLPLYRYRLAGSIAEVRHGDLAFTPTEAGTLLTAHGVRLAPAAVAALTRQNNGLAAALRLEARALPYRDNDEAPPELADYIRGELLGQQTAATRELLLRTCVAEQLPAGLAVELTGRRDAGQVLDRLAHEGVFVTVVAGEEHTYLHHPRVRGVLLSDLADGPADRIAGLNRQAARWYGGFGRYAEALPHALRAGEWELAATALVRSLHVAGALAGPDAAGYAESFAPMPLDLDTAEAAVVHAAIALYLDDPEVCAKHLLRANEMAGSAAPVRGVELPLCLSAVDVARAVRWGGATDIADTAEIAGQALDAALASGAAVPAELIGLIRLAQGDTLLRRYDLAGARHVLSSAADNAADDATGGELLGRLALVEALCGRLRHAAEHARRSLAGADPAGPLPSGAADLALAWVRADEYDLAAARAHGERAAARLADRPDPMLEGLLALVRARVLRARGDVARAAEVLTGSQFAECTGAPPWLIETLTLARAAALTPGRPPAAAGDSAQHVLAEGTAALAAGEAEGARRAAAELIDRPGQPLSVQVEGWLLLASAELADGRRDQARQALRRALLLAEGERLRRPLVEAPVSLRRFLREDHELGTRHRWLGAPPGSDAVTPSVVATPVLVESLTAKETEVLGYLAQMLSTDEIARTMFVSVNTVKTHVRGVLHKLAATRRSQAVRRARALGLL